MNCNLKKNLPEISMFMVKKTTQNGEISRIRVLCF